MAGIESVKLLWTALPAFNCDLLANGSPSANGQKAGVCAGGNSFDEKSRIAVSSRLIERGASLWIGLLTMA
jgi:hypothetical protein